MAIAPPSKLPPVSPQSLRSYKLPTAGSSGLTREEWERLREIIAARRINPDAITREPVKVPVPEQDKQDTLDALSTSDSPVMRDIVTGADLGNTIGNPIGNFLRKFANDPQMAQFLRRIPLREAESFSSNIGTAIPAAYEDADAASKFMELELAKTYKPKTTPTLTAEHRQVIDEFNLGRRGLKLVEDMRLVMLDKVTQGAWGATVSGMMDLASFLGIPAPESGKQTVNGIATFIKESIANTGRFGRDTSRVEFNKIIDKMVKTPNWFTSEENVNESLDRLKQMLEEQVRSSYAVGQTYGVPLEGFTSKFDQYGTGGMSFLKGGQRAR
jgi:hypothetical protein